MARLHEAIRKAYTAPAVVDAFAKVQMTMAPTTPQFAKDFFVREYERYTPMIKAAGVQRVSSASGLR